MKAGLPHVMPPGSETLTAGGSRVSEVLPAGHLSAAEGAFTEAPFFGGKALTPGHSSSPRCSPPSLMYLGYCKFATCSVPRLPLWFCARAEIRVNADLALSAARRSRRSPHLLLCVLAGFMDPSGPALIWNRHRPPGPGAPPSWRGSASRAALNSLGPELPGGSSPQSDKNAGQ
ncbi:hypothetical protein SKAU_G00012370 [Synaphobranchus kaupii]|uniref:Uncharacterized protein n=1 Tax=Synaphobranchus kaupii TaxID=118154 RepID=A0A9Q1JDM8_SYNKA|nr:hypothetical protein SKAU_G00012370 [Synaphobranchus kaupii]